MADITHLPTPAFATSDDLTVRATASLQAMHDRVLMEGNVDPFTHAILMLIRAIIAYLAIPLEPTTTTEPTIAPHATTPSSTPRAPAIRPITHARIIRTRARRRLRQNLRARRSAPATHPTTASRAPTIISAPHRPNPLKIVPPH